MIRCPIGECSREFEFPSELEDHLRGAHQTVDLAEGIAHLVETHATMRAALKEAREDLSIWHEQHTQASSGGIETVPCTGCSTCEDTLPMIDAALRAAAPSEVA